MTVTALQSYLEAIACPSCHSKLLLTKEQILLCQPCLLGFRLNGEVPDLRLDQAIHFRKAAGRKNDRASALFTVLTGDKKNHTFEVRLGACTVLCRTPLKDFEADTTFVGKLDEEIENTRIALDGKSLRLVEKSLLQASELLDVSPNNSQPQSLLGGFVRDVDFLIDDSKVSKTHAVIFQNKEAVWLLDLVSDTGTFLNGKEIEQAKLKTNDIISVGTVSLRVNFI